MKKNFWYIIILGLILGGFLYTSFRKEFRGGIEYARSNLISQKQVEEAKNALNIEKWASIGLNKVSSGFAAPVFLTNAGDNTNRKFVVEKKGLIKVLSSDFQSNKIFLDISDRVRSKESERGLLSVAFHPNFKNNGRFFVYYTDLKGTVTISEFNILNETKLGNKNSEDILIKIEQPYSNHNGGQLSFGPDGYLYIGTGDGGAGGDPYSHGQNKNTLLGKILRINIDGKKPYDIPSNNPFLDGSGKPEVWAYGLRNPWRFSFDSKTGDLFIADVGQNKWEEINFQSSKNVGGHNYGWNLLEGFHTFKIADNSDTSKFKMPILEYSHDQGCSVTGGYVYRGSKIKDLFGTYVFADFCSGKIWGLKKTNTSWNYSELLDSPYFISSFGTDEDGEIYLMDFNNGDIYRLITRN